MKKYKIVVYVPEDHADQLREAMGNAGAGEIGNYTHCTFTVKGMAASSREKVRTRQLAMYVGKLKEVAEDRIETVCNEAKLKEVLKAIKDAPLYEEPATDVYPIEVID